MNDCATAGFLQGRKVTEYDPRGSPHVMVPMGNSLNRVMDLVARQGYKKLLFAGCDMTPDHAGVSGQHGGAVHPSMTYGAHWGVNCDKWVVEWLKFNGFTPHSLTPKPNAYDGKQVTLKSTLPAELQGDAPAPLFAYEMGYH